MSHRLVISTRRMLTLAPAVVACLAFSLASTAQTIRSDPRNTGGVEPPALAGSVTRALAAAYLSDDEKQDQRVFHGLWTPADLNTPARRAQAALQVGVWDDPVFDDPTTPVEDRAQARLLRGDLHDAITTLTGAKSVRSRRIRAEALEALGRFDEADAAIDPVVSDLLRNKLTSAPELVEGVRALAIRARLRGEPAGDYQEIMSLLARARDELDRLYWPASLAEAQLLFSKDNRKQALEAIEHTLSLNPRCAGAWALFGRIQVDGFNMDAASDIAQKLDDLVGELPDTPDVGSPYAALIGARAQLRVNDPDGAVDKLDAALGRYPKLRSALSLRAAAQAVRYDYKGADAMLAEYDQLSPGSPSAYYEVGRALSEARQYAPAAKYLKEASARQPNWPPPLVELGLVSLQAGRDAEALSALRRVAELDPFQVRAANSLRLIEELLTYDTIESAHFIVRYRPGVDRVMAVDMLAPLEKNHDIVVGAIQYEPPQKTIIELMPDHRWFGVRITGMPAIHTIAASTGPVIAMEAPTIGVNHMGPYDWVRVVRHEYVHTVTLSRTHNRIPHWFTEAAAVHLEQAPRDYSTCQLLTSALINDTLFDMDEINIAFVRPKQPTDRSQAYAQGEWMYSYMIERFGKQSPLKLMDLYAQGVREEQAMASVFSEPRDQFVHEFKVWARQQAASWGMLPEPSIEKLLLDETEKDEAGRARLTQALDDYAQEASLTLAGAAMAGRFKPPLLDPTEEMVDGWLGRLGDHPDALELKIGFMLRESKGDVTEELAPILDRYAVARPVDPAPHRLLARYFLSQEDPATQAKAIDHLVYLDAREQSTPTFAAALARLYAEQGELDKAKDKAERATHIAPFDASMRELAARVALLQHDLSRARRHIAALVALEPGRAIHKQRLNRLDAIIKERGG